MKEAFLGKPFGGIFLSSHDLHKGWSGIYQLVLIGIGESDSTWGGFFDSGGFMINDLLTVDWGRIVADPSVDLSQAGVNLLCPIFGIPEGITKELLWNLFWIVTSGH